MVVSLITVIFVLWVSVCLGRCVLRLIGWLPSSALEDVLYSAGMGLGILSLLIFLLGIGGVLYAWVVIGLLTATLVLFWNDGRAIWLVGRKEIESLAKRKLDGFEILMFALLACMMVLNGLVSLAPLTGSDPMQGHFAIPKIYAKEHSIFPIPWRNNSYGHGIPYMFSLLGMVVESGLTAQVLNFGGMVLSVLAVFSFSRKFVSKRNAVVVTLLYAVSPMVYWEGTSGYVDLWMVFYGLLAVSSQYSGPAPNTSYRTPRSTFSW